MSMQAVSSRAGELRYSYASIFVRSPGIAKRGVDWLRRERPSFLKVLKALLLLWGTVVDLGG